MVSFNFPASPTEGQIYAPAGGPQYVYRAPYWRASGRVDTIIAETPPAGPKPGQLWFSSSTGNTYIWYEDPNSAQWVQINVGTDAHTFLSGTGAPNGVVIASVGALYTRLDGGTGSTLYVKESGVETDTGWVAK